jgi:Flp pilus assembly pilin Flp
MNRHIRVSRSLVVSRGQTMTEYALILATIAAITVALINNAGTIISELVGTVSHLL